MTTYPLQLKGGASGGVQTVFTWSGKILGSSGYALYNSRMIKLVDKVMVLNFYVWQTSDSEMLLVLNTF